MSLRDTLDVLLGRREQAPASASRPTTATPGQRRRRRLEAAFAEEEYRGLVLATRVRAAALAIITIWITIENPYPEFLFFYLFIAGFAVLGFLPLALRDRGLYAPWQRYLFPALEFMLLTVAVFSDNPLGEDTFPAAMNLRFGNEMYLFVFLASTLFSYSPRVVLVSGIAAAVVWSAATLWVLSLPESVGLIPPDVWESMSRAERLDASTDPNRVWIGPWLRLVVLLVVISATMATAVWRSRRMVMQQAEAERQRANLSRYFPDTMVEELSRADDPVRTSSSQNVAVLFADIVGFTGMSERLSPAEVINLLRDFHRRVEKAVFAHGGTLDKYIGDGVMVTFGTPREGTRDAGNALLCAKTLLAEVASGNEARLARGEEPVRIGIGLHYGPVIAGDVGGDRRLEYTVIGDTVNVASRLEALTRRLDVSLLVSADLLAVARAEGALAESDLADLVEVEPQQVRGREGALDLWALKG